VGAAVLALGSGGAALLAIRATSTGGVDRTYADLGRGLDGVTLVDDVGDEVRWGTLKGRPRAVFFGFTHCPVICPVTVFELNDAIDDIGGPDIAIEFVTIDPERDTPARLQEYFSGFGERVRAFTGTPEAIAQLAGAFEVVYRRGVPEEGGYTMDHTATVFLLDSSGRVVDVIAYGSPAEVIQARLRALVGEAPQASD
jgi:protein SCO1/2